jgi:L-amino acid N-acyltransferase YncA
MIEVKIRKLNIKDWKAVSEIYRLGIESGHATFEKNVPTWIEWDRKQLSICRLVAEYDNEVVGWAALSPVSAREAYKGVAELSLYVSPAFIRKGIGKQLLKELIEDSEKKGIWTLQATMFPKNSASIHLHEHCGFRKVGNRAKIAKLGGKWRDTVLYERRSRAKAFR